MEAVREVLGSLTGPVTFHRAFDEADDPLKRLAGGGGEAPDLLCSLPGGGGGWEGGLRVFRRSGRQLLRI